MESLLSTSPAEELLAEAARRSESAEVVDSAVETRRFLTQIASLCLETAELCDHPNVDADLIIYCVEGLDTAVHQLRTFLARARALASMVEAEAA